MANLPNLQSLAAMFATCLTLWVTAVLLLLAYLHLHARAATRCRDKLGPYAERLVIEKRWMERHAKSRAEFQARWDHEVRQLHKAHVSRPVRLIYRLNSFERTLNATFATILGDEVASWTFADRMSFSPASYEKLMLRCLRSIGWRLDYQDGEHFVLIRDRKRVIVHLVWADRDLECLPVGEVAAAASRIGCSAAYVITNGRLGGAASAMATEMNVVALHCSQLDLVAPRAAAFKVVRSTARERMRLAA
ncbi:hypothetical protein MKK65_00775 [Methylobacterium sp. J-001]|uniref:hypothetical protein n=1 Tax=Methylobacterium sp. J-001 TaxID=2836609 RepID=UPI001FB958F6|nr:hypothetical protein [Methylobacterium sp. J-001]MCJ2115145.1 hypothetical protein [Methylobacterium sp. J-001]